MDPIKKAAAVINEYLTDFFEDVKQLPTKDLDMVRRIAGHWSLVKQLLRAYTAECMKDENLDQEYVKAVLDDFKKATALLDRLANIYKTVSDFDQEGIKTYTEPFMKMVERAKGQEEPAAGPPAEAAPEQMPAPEEDMEEKMASCLDNIANEIQTQDPIIAMAIDKISDQLEKSQSCKHIKALRLWHAKRP